MKILKIDPEKCTGCELCAIACSILKNHTCNPDRAAIRILRNEFESYEIPLVCVHCAEPLCLQYCPQNAYTDANGVVVHDDSRCILCGMCAILCPHSGITFTGEELLKCDLCGGDPVCIKFCSTNAIEYVDAEEPPVKARFEHANKIRSSKRAKQAAD